MSDLEVHQASNELHPEDELNLRQAESFKYEKYARFVMAVLGVLPWFGPLLAAGSAAYGEKKQEVHNLLLTRWMQEHEQRLQNLQTGLATIINRVKSLGEDAEKKLNEEGFLKLARRAYRAWDKAQSSEKRKLFERLLINAAGTHLCSKDMVRLFIDWIDRYDETHFRIIAAIHTCGDGNLTRLGIWLRTSGEEVPREDSSQADLYRLLIHDLSVGHVIRIERAIAPDGNRIRQKPSGKRKRGVAANQFLQSSFEDKKRYELTQLGKEFVHYVLNDAVPRLTETSRVTN